MEAMTYELFMRAVYDCGRDYKKGADADIYRDMELTERLIDDSNWKGTKSEKEYNFQKNFSKVRNYVHDAMKSGMSKVAVSSAEKIEVDEMVSRLGMTFYSKKELDAIIERARDIFSAHGLKA
jgi:hypothetical protein